MIDSNPEVPVACHEAASVRTDMTKILAILTAGLALFLGGVFGVMLSGFVIYAARLIQLRPRLILSGLADRTAPPFGSTRSSQPRKAEPSRLC